MIVIRPSSLVDEGPARAGPFSLRAPSPRLISDLDEVGLTLSRLAAIDAYEERHWAQKPWLRPQ
jgi:hypothetical protein